MLATDSYIFSRTTCYNWVRVFHNRVTHNRGSIKLVRMLQETDTLNLQSSSR